MENNKMMKSAKVIDRILRILQGFMIAFGIVSFVFTVLAFTIGEGIVADASYIELGSVKLRLFDTAVPSFEALRPGIVIKLIAVIVMMAAGWYLLHIIRAVFRPMKEGRPFDEGTSAMIRKLAWTELVSGAVIEFCRVFGSIAEVKGFDLSRLINPEAVRSIDYTYTYRSDFVIVALILFFLARVFSHGETLQKESDETL